ETMQSVLGDALSGSSLLSGMLPSANDLSETIRGTTFGIDGTLQRDLSHTAVQMESAISVANKELTDVVLLANGNDIALQIPALTSQSLGWSAEDLSGQVNGSAFARQFDLTLPEGISLSLYATLPVKLSMMSQLPELLAQSIGSFGTDFEAAQLSQTREVTIEGDDTKQCTAYEVIWQERGITLILWIDEDGMIRRIEGETVQIDVTTGAPLTLTDVDLYFLGAEMAAGTIEGEGRITSEEMKDLSFTIQSTYTQEETTYERAVSLSLESGDPQLTDGEISYEGSGDLTDLSFELEAEGLLGGQAFDAVLHGRFAETETEGWQVILTKGKLSDETGELCRVTGSISIYPLEEELSVTLPQRLMLFEATQSEVEDLIAEVSGNIMGEVMRYVDALDYLKIFGF
ncbi:MAG: hypothetical protein K6G23_00790, partial [Lachnospiraceae bacterium]|nr:hypothetical protein [Lachnospiraceae bacterium]